MALADRTQQGDGQSPFCFLMTPIRNH